VRIGVLDVGSNTVHLLVVDAHRGAAPVPAFKHKTELRLAELLDADGAVTPAGADHLVALVAEAERLAEGRGAARMLAFATSAIRDAANSQAVLDRVRTETGVELEVLSGEDEARLTFLAARRWFGWSSGRLLLLDIGGGSLEVAVGVEEAPEAAFSVALGAGRLTRDHVPTDPPTAEEWARLSRFVRQEVARDLGRVLRQGAPDLGVATSKTFRSLARICGAAPSAEGPYVRRELRRVDLEEWIPKLAAMPSAERLRLPGVSAGRASQLFAGAVVAGAVMDLMELEALQICPWALREGVLLHRIDQMTAD
jgi:exopolyphosphatase / guanosine-5'-triphosphate,3'-diphosphate pyrophosphatase